MVRLPSDARLVGAQFDAVLSLSAFDHDGLGRYGDPISPDGDLLTMDLLLTALVRPHTGLLLLSVPVGPDGVFWNLHRRYGRVRLPLLLSGWELAEGRYSNPVGWDATRISDTTMSPRKSYEPVFVLRPGVAGREEGGLCRSNEGGQGVNCKGAESVDERGKGSTLEDTLGL
jgi:hypothetical protein